MGWSSTKVIAKKSTPGSLPNCCLSCQTERYKEIQREGTGPRSLSSWWLLPEPKQQRDPLSHLASPPRLGLSLPSTGCHWLRNTQEREGPQRYAQLATVRRLLSIRTKSLGTFDLTPLPEAAKQTSGLQAECGELGSGSSRVLDKAKGGRRPK